MSATLLNAALSQADASLALAASIRRCLAGHPGLLWRRPSPRFNDFTI